MAASFRLASGLALLFLGLAALALGGCDAGSAGEPASDNARGAPTLRIVQPRPHARVPLWEEERQLGKLKILFDIGSTRLATAEGDGYRLLTRTDDRPATRVHDVHTALVRKPHVGKHVLYAWLESTDGTKVAEASVPFEVLDSTRD